MEDRAYRTVASADEVPRAMLDGAGTRNRERRKLQLGARMGRRNDGRSIDCTYGPGFLDAPCGNRSNLG